MNSILETVEGSIKIVQYNKPSRKNAIDRDMYIQVIKIFRDAAEDTNISMIILTGTGDYYSSGNDLKAAAEEIANEKILWEIVRDYINAFITFPKLLVAIVNGPAVGIAATTLALCDLVFAAESSFFYTPFTKLGLVAEGCSTFTFPRMIGDRKAAEMLLCNDKMSAREALDCGFVNYVYKPGEIKSKVWNKILEVSQLPQQCICSTKKLLRRNMQDELLRTNEKEMEALKQIWTSTNYVTYVKNFASKL